MKKFLFPLIPILFLFACSASKKVSQPIITSSSIDSSGTIVRGDGFSFQTAIVIEAKNESTGVDKEYKWLSENYRGYTLISQALSFDKGKPYDIMSIKTSEGIEKKIYFDISKFFGKW